MSPTNDSPSSAEIRRGRLLMVAAAVMWSTSGAFLKSPPLEALPHDQRGPLVACYRGLFAAACLAPLVRRRSVRFRPMLLPLVGAYAAMNVLFITAMTRTTAAAAIFLQYTSTVWAFVFGWMFLKERITRGNFIALLCAVAGIASIVAGDWGGEHFYGNLLGLGSGIAYAVVVLSLRYLRDEDPAWLVALNNAVSGLVLLPWALSVNIPLDGTQWLLVALLGVVQMAIPYVVFARAVRHVVVQEAALLLLLEPVLNPVWVWLLWGERVPATTLLGGALILGGLFVRYVFFGRRMRRMRDKR